MYDKVELESEACGGSKKRSSTAVQMCGDLAAKLLSEKVKKRLKKSCLGHSVLELGTISSPAHNFVHYTVEVLLLS